MRVAINGFGRIGRTIFRANLVDPRIDIVAINNLGDHSMAAFLLKYDSNYGVLDMDIRFENDKFIVDGKETIIVSDRDPEKLPWDKLDIDLVIECTGVFRTKELASKHITAGAKRVMLSAPAKDEIDASYLYGVNHEDYDPESHFIVSNASCTTNCLGPVSKVLEEEFGIERGLFTTIHSYTNDQNLQDNDHKKLDRTRAAALNMIPTSTGAAKTVDLCVPNVAKKLDGVAVRVPTPTVSLVDLTVILKKEASPEEINNAFKKWEAGGMKGILGVTDLPLVSSDFKGENRSAVVASLQTQTHGPMAKVMAWYDNEWGYSTRCIDLAAYMASKS